MPLPSCRRGNPKAEDQSAALIGSFYKEDLAILQQNTAEKQEPFASVLSCADSRVPVELIFDQSIGHVFVNRIAGNIATTEIMASIEYGAAVLGTKVIMVLGHGNCGAVKATIDGKAVARPDQLPLSLCDPRSMRGAIIYGQRSRLCDDPDAACGYRKSYPGWRRCRDGLSSLWDA